MQPQVQNQDGYNKLIGLGYSPADAAKQADSTKPNPNFYPRFAGDKPPADFTGTFRSSSGADVAVQNGQLPVPPTPPTNPTQPGQMTPEAMKAQGYKYNIYTGQPVNGAPASGASTGQQAYNGTQPPAPNRQAGFQAASSSGQPAPTSAGAARSAVDQYTPPLQNNPINPVDTALANDKGYQQLLADHTSYLNSLSQRDSLVNEYKSLQASLGLPALNHQLMDMKKVIDGTEDDIRTEVTKAGGFATNSQVMALSLARNKVLIQNYNNILQTKNDAQTQLTTLMGLTEKDRADADKRFDNQMQYNQKISDYREKATKNASEAYTKIISTPGYGYQALFKSTGGDAHTISLVENTLGLQPGMLKTLSSQAPKDLQFISGTANQAAGTFDKVTGKFTPLAGGSGGTNGETPSSGAVTTNGTPIPLTLTPYLNTSSSGVQYIDASTLQGTAAQKTKLINQASALGLKVITNKNTAADLVNIQDANSKLDSIQNIMSGISQPGWIQRSLYGLGLTKLAQLTQSDPQKAAAGALESVGLDILKAISGVQGFRGNQTAIQQVTGHLPKVTDTTAVINQKISYLKTLISDRENAAVGTSKPSQSSQPSSGNTHSYNGVTYKLINGTWTPQ